MEFEVDRHPDGAVFRLARPHKLNSLTRTIFAGLTSCIDELETNGARFLIVTAEGERAFCAGTDLGEAAALALDQRGAKNDMARSLLYRLSRSALFSVAALNGLAYGGGLELAMACTLRVALPHVKLSLPEVKLGVLPAYGGTQFLPALIGPGRAADLMLTGRAIGASEALSIGLINRIADPSSPLIDQALDYARSVTQFSPVAVAGIRRCLAVAGSVVTEQGLAVEAEASRLVSESDDAREGVAAFLEKRPPVFAGR
jgi:enoyl-CoA hydratase